MIGRYEIIKEIGRGGMGLVYLANDPYLKCQIAIKMMSPAIKNSDYPLMFERFLKEAEVLAKLNHPNIVRIFDISPKTNPSFISMEYVNGHTFQELVQSKSQLTLLKKIDYLIKVTEGLSAIHKAGLVHRDMKPANIMVNDAGVVKIMDFGIIKDLESDVSNTQTQGLIGSPSYMSPEQITGKKISGKSDIFSLGIIIYEFITEEPLFLASTLPETLSNILTVKISNKDHFKQLDKTLKKILLKLMSRNPNERYASCSKILVDLRKYKSEIQRKNKINKRFPPIKILTLSFIFCLIAFLIPAKKKIQKNPQANVTTEINKQVKTLPIDTNLLTHEYFNTLGVCGDQICTEIEKLCPFPFCPQDCYGDNASNGSVSMQTCADAISKQLKPFNSKYPSLKCGDQICTHLEETCGICAEDCPSSTGDLLLSSCDVLFRHTSAENTSHEYSKARIAFEKCAFKENKSNLSSQQYLQNVITCVSQSNNNLIQKCLKSSDSNTIRCLTSRGNKFKPPITQKINDSFDNNKSHTNKPSVNCDKTSDLNGDGKVDAIDTTMCNRKTGNGGTNKNIHIPPGLGSDKPPH